VTAVADKWAALAGISRAVVLLGANVVMVLATVWMIGAYARSVRRRLERLGVEASARAAA
jgi:hypothetical protein